MEPIKMGVIGLGQRGLIMLKDVLMYYNDVKIVAVCDSYADRNEEAAELVMKKYGEKPFVTTDYRELLRSGLCQAVYIVTSWETHLEVAMEAMRNHVIAGVEVGCAYDIDQCYRFVRTYEETGTPCMMMENCCFGKEELLATSLARAGKFGTIVNCHGAYSHDLRSEITAGHVIRHYRLRNYRGRNTENYPTHELGPIARLLNINRGNRMMTLCSMSSKACGLSEYVKSHPEVVEKDPSLADTVWNQGDVVNTIIKCANGETITLRLDTTLPHSYSREFTVRGTKGNYEQNTHTVFFDGDKEEFDTWKFYQENINNAAKYENDYLPSAWLTITEEEKKSGHGGMDLIMFRRFLDCIKENKPMPIDVYDAVSWMAVGALAEQSISMGGAVVPIPDFTCGAWLSRPCEDVIDLPHPEEKN